MFNRICVFAGTQGACLAQKICLSLSIEVSNAKVGRFNDGEVNVQLLDNVRGADVFIINPTNPPAENFLELLLLAQAAHGSSAGRVTLVIPYLGYNRQERKDKPRMPISAKTVIDILKLSMAHRVLLLDLHSEATAAHFEPIVFDHLYASYAAIPSLKEALADHPFVVASPDAGGVPRARKYAKHLGSPGLVIFSKERQEPGQIEENSIQIIGEVDGKDVLFVDDMIDTGGTLIANAEKARHAGAKRLFAFATHGIFSKNAFTRFSDSLFTKIIVTDSIQHDPANIAKAGGKVEICSIAPLLAKAIQRLHSDASLSSLILK